MFDEIKSLMEKISSLQSLLISIIKPHDLQNELVSLMSDLFGQETGNLIKDNLKGKNPEIILEKWKGMMEKILGTENASKEIDAIISKFKET